MNELSENIKTRGRNLTIFGVITIVLVSWLAGVTAFIGGILAWIERAPEMEYTPILIKFRLERIGLFAIVTFFVFTGSYR